MIDVNTVTETLKLYSKHGWTLRRVLLTDTLRKSVGGASESLFGRAAVFSSELDAAWFTRAARDGRETWELRYFGETPFALIEVIAADTPADERDEILGKTEAKMLETIGRRSRSG
jgi:hypothetical protein